MFDPSHVGHCFEPITVTVESAPLKLFLKAIGETNPVYTDEQVARQHGLRSLLAPPTYLYCLQSLGNSTEELEQLLQIGDAVHLHGEQAFEYFSPVCVGDRITFRESIADVYSKKGGQLDFVVTETRATNQLGEDVALIRSTSLVSRESP